MENATETIPIPNENQVVKSFTEIFCEIVNTVPVNIEIKQVYNVKSIDRYKNIMINNKCKLSIFNRLLREEIKKDIYIPYVIVPQTYYKLVSENKEEMYFMVYSKLLYYLETKTNRYQLFGSKHKKVLYRKNKTKSRSNKSRSNKSRRNKSKTK